MIQINLLPPEYRVKDRPGLSRLFGLSAAAACVALSVVFYLWFKVALVRPEREHRDERIREEQQLALQAKDYDDLVAKKARYEQRKNRIKEVQEAHPYYAPILLHYAKVAWDGEAPEQGANGFKAWYTSLKVDEARGRGGPTKKPVPEITLDAYLHGNDPNSLANFYRVFKDNAFLAAEMNLGSMSSPDFAREEFKNYSPDAALKFTPKVALKSAEDKKKEQEAARKAAAAKGGAKPSAAGAAGAGTAPPAGVPGGPK